MQSTLTIDKPHHSQKAAMIAIENNWTKFHVYISIQTKYQQHPNSIDAFESYIIEVSIWDAKVVYVARQQGFNLQPNFEKQYSIIL